MMEIKMADFMIKNTKIRKVINWSCKGVGPATEFAIIGLI